MVYTLLYGILAQNSRIIGGKYARSGDFPYMVLIEFDISDTIVRHCGGSIISDQWILTAGHCILE